MLSHPFNPSKVGYEIHVPPSSKEIRVEVQIEAAQRCNHKAAAPVVVLCFGGGPGTLNQLAGAGSKPIIIVRGSERAAEFVDDWSRWESKMAATLDDVEKARLRDAQLEHAQRNLREDLAGANATTYIDTENQEVKPDWWDVSRFVEILQKLGQHEQLSFFDMNQTVGMHTKKNLRLNPMLPKILDGVLRSTSIKTSVKLPLAIRINDADYVNVALSNQGLKKYSVGSAAEWSEDARPLIYAAFHDHGKVLDTLIQTGFELGQLDALISLELQRTLDEPFLIRRNEPPPWWIQSERDRDGTIDPDLIEARWRKLNMDEKKKIYRTVNWSMMPSLEGWKFSVQSTDEPDAYLKGASLRMMKRHYLEGECQPDGLQERTFVVHSPDAHGSASLQIVTAVDEPRDDQTSSTLCCKIKKIGRHK
jgi:hypothetical protein